MTNNNRNICHTKQYKNKRYDMKYQIIIKDSTGAVCLGEFCESSTSLPMRSVTCIKIENFKISFSRHSKDRICHGSDIFITFKHHKCTLDVVHIQCNN